MEREQERGGKIKEERSRRRSTQVGETEPATTFSVAEETTIASAGNNQACSDGRSREDEYSSSERARGRTEYGGFSQMGPLCNGNR